MVNGEVTNSVKHTRVDSAIKEMGDLVLEDILAETF
jgi:hypothetical protein